MEPRVILYTRPSCHLCGEARQVVVEVCAQAGVGWAEIDIDAHEDPRVDADLRDRMTDLVPVVVVDGVQVGYWRIKAENVRMALARGGGE